MISRFAKAKAREQAFTELEEQKPKLPACDDESRDSFLALPTPASDRKHKPLPSPVNTPVGLAAIKTELKRIEKKEPQQLNPAAPEFHYRAFLGEIKGEIKPETPSTQKSDEELLKEVFKIQQDQIQNMISSQQQLATAVTLPQPEVPKFGGDPMKYKTFIMAFDVRIQSRVASNADRLYYLDQHLTSEPKDLIGGCLHIEPDEGYTEARKLLQKEYGDPYKVSNAFMQNASWPVIKYDDGPALKRFSFFLTKCNNSMKNIAHMTVLNRPPNMQSIVQKLPNNLQTKWCENVEKNRRKDGKIAGFGDLTKFVEYAAESANDPIYSKDALSAKSKARPASNFTNYKKKLPTPRQKSTSFANLEAWMIY